MRRQDEEQDAALTAGFLERPLELGAPSTWIALTGKGMRATMASRNRAALAEVACVPTAPLRVGEDAPGHRGGDGPAPLAQLDGDLVLAVTGRLLPEESFA